MTARTVIVPITAGPYVAQRWIEGKSPADAVPFFVDMTAWCSSFGVTVSNLAVTVTPNGAGDAVIATLGFLPVGILSITPEGGVIGTDYNFDFVVTLTNSTTTLTFELAVKLLCRSPITDTTVVTTDPAAADAALVSIQADLTSANAALVAINTAGTTVEAAATLAISTIAAAVTAAEGALGVTVSGSDLATAVTTIATSATAATNAATAAAASAASAAASATQAASSATSVAASTATAISAATSASTSATAAASSATATATSASTAATAATNAAASATAASITAAGVPAVAAAAEAAIAAAVASALAIIGVGSRSGQTFEITQPLLAGTGPVSLEIAPSLTMGIVAKTLRLNNPGTNEVSASWMSNGTLIPGGSITATGTVVTGVFTSSPTLSIGSTLSLVTTGTLSAGGSITFYGAYA